MAHALKFEEQLAYPVASTAEEALVHLERTNDQLQRAVHLLLRRFGISPTQYSALRILRLAAEQGVTCSAMARRLVSTDPDVTRLLDRLARQSLVVRHRDLRDRRVVVTEITEEGKKLLRTVTPLLDEHVRGLLSHMPEERQELLIELLDEARDSGARRASVASMPDDAPMRSSLAG